MFIYILFIQGKKFLPIFLNKNLCFLYFVHTQQILYQNEKKNTLVLKLFFNDKYK